MNETPEIAKEGSEEEFFECSKCGADVSEDDKFCRKCGTDVSEIEEDIDDESEFKCSTCGADVSGDNKFCQKCRTDVIEIEGDDAEFEKSDADMSENDSWW